MIPQTVLWTSALMLVAAVDDARRAAMPADPPATQLAAALASWAAGSQTEPAAEEDDLLAIEKNIVKYTNAQRAKYGLASLQVDPELMESARQHASWMARNQSLVHTRRPVAENIASGQPHSLSVVRDWMNSSGHRANILNRGYRRIGVAAYRTPGGRIYWCQQFRR